ncbi:MAG: hypothetical protein APF84_09830 [Gracilibacter sp. BRH_c7a]|nr:MAG: hypothetical protein APF84_09830 [Gracilibacter sp. BRH_c7a]
MFYIEQIDKSTVEKFEKLTYTEYRPFLYKIGDSSQVVAFGALNFSSQPVGLILAELKNDGNIQIHTLFVKQKYRRRGIATALIREMEQAGEINQYQGIYLEFTHDNPLYDIFQKLLQKCDWSFPATIEMLLYKLDMEEIDEKDAPLFTRMELPSCFTISSWDELQIQEFEYIKNGQGIWYPEKSSPFSEEERVDSLNSIFLRDENHQIIGWAITHQLDSETMLYRNVFVKEEYQLMGYAMLLMGEAIWRQYDRGIYKLMFCVNVSNKSMVKIINRFMKPFNYTVKKKMRLSKSL